MHPADNCGTNADSNYSSLEIIMEYYGITDIGSSRTSNQDTFRALVLDDPDLGIFLVCDGMGGAKAGNIASWMTAEYVSAEVRKNLTEKYNKNSISTYLSKAIMKANDAVYKKSCTEEDCRGMGTTIVAAVCAGDDLIIANVGDSRAYLINEKGILKITRDHSLVEDLIMRGEITKDAARFHPHKNIITRAIGTSNLVLPDIFSPNITEEDIILLCSDGLSNVITDDEIKSIVINSANLQEAAENLIKNALTNSAPDNITAVLFKI